MYGTKQRFNRSPTEDSSLNNTLPREHSIEDSFPRPYASLDYYTRMRHKNVGPCCNENPRSIHIANALKMHATSASKVVHNGPSSHYNHINHMNNKIDNQEDLFPDESFEEIRTEEDIFLPRGSSHKQTVNNQRDESPYPDSDDDYGTEEYVGEDEDETPRIDIIKGSGNGQTFLDILYGTPKAGRHYSGTEGDDTEEEKHYVNDRHSRAFTNDNITSREYEELRPRHTDPHAPSPLHEVPKSNYHRRAHSGKREDKYDSPQPYQHVSHQGQPANTVPEAAKRMHRYAAEPFGKDRSHSGAGDKNSSFSECSSTARTPYANGATIGAGVHARNSWHRMPESPIYRSQTTHERNSTRYRVSEENQRDAEKRGESNEKGARRVDENDKKERMRDSSESMHKKRQGKDSEVKGTSSDHERIGRKTRRQKKDCKLPPVAALMAVKEGDDDATAPNLSSIAVAFETHEHVPKWSWDRPNKPPMAKNAVAKQHEEQAEAAQKQVEAKRKEKKDAAKALANSEKARKKHEEEKENKEAKQKAHVGKVSTGCFGRCSKGTENEATQTSDEKVNGINGVEKRRKVKEGALEKSRSKHATRTKEDKRPTENLGKSKEPCETNGKKHHSRSHSRPRRHSRSHSHSRSRPGHRRDGADDASNDSCRRALAHAGSTARRSGEEPGRRRSESSRRRRTQSRRIVERKDNVDNWSDVN